MRLVLTVDALSDVAHVLSYLEEQSPSAAPDGAASIDAAAKALVVFPRAARFDRDSRTYEWLIRGQPLLLIYTVSDDLIEVIAVFHTSRDPAQKRRRPA
jgi:toxin ParE1/3/4